MYAGRVSYEVHNNLPSLLFYLQIDSMCQYTRI